MVVAEPIVGLLEGTEVITLPHSGTVRVRRDRNGRTIHGDPATTGHFKRYALLLLTVSAARWAAARVLGPGFR